MVSGEMCGRIVQARAHEMLSERLGAHVELRLMGHPRYNLGPTDTIGVVWQHCRELTYDGMVWGVRPHWASHIIFNARGEKYVQGGWWSRWRRGLVPVDGFYEWAHPAHRRAEPWYVKAPGGEPLFIAALWRPWRTENDEDQTVVVLLTTHANDVVGRLHDRMPVIIAPDESEDWLSPLVPHEAVEPLLEPVENASLIAHRVAFDVNTAGLEGPQLVLPLAS